MTEETAWGMIRGSLQSGLMLSAPLLLSLTVVGLLTSVLQALTQVQEQTLGFVVKVATTLTLLWLLGPWMLHRMCDNLRAVLESLAQ